MHNYLKLLQKVMNTDTVRNNRTGVATKSIFGEQIRFDLTMGYPLVTTKKVHFKSVVHELLWMISGSTNNNDLNKHGVTIWDEWAEDDGNLGPIYGKQWRSWDRPQLKYEGPTTLRLDKHPLDQLQASIDLINSDPGSRRNIVSAWNPADIPNMVLAPCHCFFQWYVTDEYRLSCHMYQRSADAFLGVPFNIASYALLTHMVAQVTDLRVGELVISYGDLHIYKNHFEQVIEQLSRDPVPRPALHLTSNVRSIDGFGYEDIKLVDYNPHSAIKAEVAI